MDLTSPVRALVTLGARDLNEVEEGSKDRLLSNLSRTSGVVAGAEEVDLLTAASLAISLSDIRVLLTSNKWECKATAYACFGEVARVSSSEELLTQFFFEEDLAFFDCLVRFLKADLENIEPRVRAQCALALYWLAKVVGERVWSELGEVLIMGIETSLSLKVSERAKNVEKVYERETGVEPDHFKLSAAVAHETMGWKALETSLRALKSVVEGVGLAFVEPHKQRLTSHLVELITERCLVHENRFVREVALDLCGVFAEELATASKSAQYSGAYAVYLDNFAHAICAGLKDNWSQVRYAASVATRRLFRPLGADGREKYLKEFVPPMCLNRYYLAHGVKVYSQETWSLVFGNKGVDMVRKYIDPVAQFYIEQSKADNHAVREAACFCIAELATKVADSEITGNTFSQLIPVLLEALISCFKDESWPVRDAACVASAKFVSGFPAQSKNMIESELYGLWFAHLSDNIWSVREDSAVALGTVIQAYQPRAQAELGFNPLDKVCSMLPVLLSKVFEEAAMALGTNENGVRYIEIGHDGMSQTGSTRSRSDSLQKYTSRKALPKGVVTGYIADLAQFEAVSRSHTHEIENPDQAAFAKFSNQQMFSCGSLAPKLRRGVGCMDHGFSRPKKPWETTDGAVYLLRELCQVAPNSGEQFLPHLGRVVNEARFFEEYYLLQKNIWECLPVIAQGIGKRQFKRHLEVFLEKLVLDTQSENSLLENSALECVCELEKFIGKEIFRYRVEAQPKGAQLVEIISRLLPLSSSQPVR